jgi:hypothetical protein
MKSFSLSMIPIKILQQSTPGLGMTYPEAVSLFKKMKEQDSRVVFYTIRPLGDEVWNMVDGKKTIGEIATACTIEFGINVDEVLFLPIFEGLWRNKLISI